MNLEEDHDINCRVILILYQDIDISTVPCLYFGNSHAYVLVRATKGISKIMNYFCTNLLGGHLLTFLLAISPLRTNKLTS